MEDAELRLPNGMYFCCANLNNRVVIDDEADPSLKHERCSVCDRNHYELSVDPIKLGIHMAPIGN